MCHEIFTLKAPLRRDRAELERGCRHFEVNRHIKGRTRAMTVKIVLNTN